MANKSINALENAASLANNDLLVIWQDSTNTAKNLTGQQMTDWLVALANGHGGISTIAKTGTAGLVDTYTITYADTSTGTFTVTNGAQGVQGDQTYVYIAYSQDQPTSDADIQTSPLPWMGIYVGLESDPANLHYTDFTWYLIKGNQGDTGASISSIVKVSSVGLTDTYNVVTDTNVVVGTFEVINGAGGVSTVNNISPDGDGNVYVCVPSVKDLSLNIGTAVISDAYSRLPVNSFLVCPSSDFSQAQMPYVNSAYLSGGTIEIFKGDGSNGWIVYHGDSNGDYRMSVSGGTPSGTWVGQLTRNSIVAEAKSFGSVSVAGEASKDFSVSVAKTGYTPLGFLSVTGTGTTPFRVTDYYVDGTTAHIWAVNTASDTRSVTWNPTILYIKN